MNNAWFHFRFSSIFGRTLLVMAAMTLAIGAFFSVFVASLYEERYSSREAGFLLLDMKEASQTADQTVSALNTRMSGFLQDQDVSRLLVSGREPDKALIVSALSQLSRFAELDADALEAYLYLPASKSVLGSDKSVRQTEQFPDPALFETKENILCQNGEAWLLMDYPEAKPLARMIVRLNLPELYRKMGLAAGQTTADGAVCVYDSGGIPVFSGLLQYPDPESMMISRETSIEGGGKSFQAENGSFLVYESDETGWFFIRKRRPAFLMADFLRILPALSVYLILSLLLLGLASLYLIRKVHRPLNEALAALLSLSGKESEKDAKSLSGDELRLLWAIADGDRIKQKQTREILRSVSASLSRHLFSRLLKKGEWDAAVIRDTLEQIESPFSLECPCRVLAVRFYGSQGNAAPNPLEAELLGMQLARCAEDYWKETKTPVQPVPVDEQTIAFVLRAKASLSEGVWRRELECFEKLLSRNVSCRNFHLVFGGGAEEAGLLELDSLWIQAEEELKQRAEASAAQSADQLFPEKITERTSETNSEKLSHVDEAVRLIQKEYADSSLSLDFVSQKLGLTASYLSRIFAEYQPPGFLDYLNRCRLAQAKRKLSESKQTVGEIGVLCGFNSSQSFIRVFRRYEGETPGQFRSRIREEEA